MTKELKIKTPYGVKNWAYIKSLMDADVAKDMTPGAPDLLEACKSLLFALEERHTESMIEEDGSMEKHKALEPSCDYCRRIAEAEQAIKAYKLPLTRIITAQPYSQAALLQCCEQAAELVRLLEKWAAADQADSYGIMDEIQGFCSTYAPAGVVKRIKANMPLSWEERVRIYERQGMTRSDAQGVVDAEDIKEGQKKQKGFAELLGLLQEVAAVMPDDEGGISLNPADVRRINKTLKKYK